jgi:hypothetical protein
MELRYFGLEALKLGILLREGPLEVIRLAAQELLLQLVSEEKRILELRTRCSKTGSKPSEKLH